MKNLAIYTRDSTLSNLSFVIPYDKETATFKSREETAKSWVGANGSKHILANDCVNGYEITRCDTRYTTDANHFQIKHPSGFEFQISADRFFELVQKYNIHKGIIDAELCLSGGAALYLNNKKEQEAEDIRLIQLEEQRKLAAKELAKERKKNPYLKLTDTSKVQILTRKKSYEWATPTQYLFIPRLIIQSYVGTDGQNISIEEQNVYCELTQYYGQAYNTVSRKVEKVNSIVSIEDFTNSSNLHIHSRTIEEILKNNINAFSIFGLTGSDVYTTREKFVSLSTDTIIFRCNASLY